MMMMRAAVPPQHCASSIVCSFRARRVAFLLAQRRQREPQRVIRLHRFQFTSFSSSSSSSGPSSSSSASSSPKVEFVRAGLPLVLFSVMSAWVLSNAIEGRTKESELAKGKLSKSERQARMEEEREEMMTKLNKLAGQDFDNTKRIERPQEILERRRKERERNANNAPWYKRWS